MRSARKLLPITALAPVFLLTGCIDLTGLLDRRPPSIVERDGLSYQVMVTESRYSYGAYEYRVRITNTSHHTIERWLPRTMVTPRVYRDGHWTRPVWDPCGWSCGDYFGSTVRVRLRRGEAVEGWWGEVRARDFGSHGARIYHLVLVIDTGRDRFEVLGLPELHVH